MSNPPPKLAEDMPTSSSDPANQADSLFAAILESCSENSIVALSLDFKILVWNKGAQQLFLYDSAQMIGRSFLDTQDPQEVSSGKFQNLMAEAKQSGKWSGELKFMRKDGTQISVLSIITMIRNTGESPIGYTILSQNCAELSSKLQVLTESQEYTRSLIESNIDVLVTTDSLGIITDVNRQMCEITELSREELINSSFKNHFKDKKRAEDLIRKVLSNNRITNYELLIKSQTDKLTPVSFNATTFRAPDGRLKGIFATARNIVEQKRLEDLGNKQSDDLLNATNVLNDVLKSSISYSIIAVDLEGTILVWNEGARRNYYYSADEMIDKNTIWVLFNPEDIQSGRAKSVLDEALKKGKHESVLEHLRKNGEIFPVLFSVTVRRDAEGNPVGFVLISKDITLQKQQEQALREQLSYNRSLFESSIDLQMATDPLGIFTDVNKQMCIVTGYNSGELIDTEFKDYFTDPKKAQDCIRGVLSNEKIKNYELTLKTKDSKEMVVSCNATTFQDADNNLKGVFIVARDITEQKRLEVERQEQNNKLKETTGFLNNVLESSTAYSIIAEDLEGNILAWNEGARLNYGYLANEMIGKQKTTILHSPEDIESGRLQAVLDSALKTGKGEGVLDSIRKNGERFTASIALTLRKDANGNPVGYLLMSKDITDQKREAVLVSKNVKLEEQNRLAQEANRLKSEFLANMSHELRSPLNGIIGFAELMHLGKVGPVSPDHKEYLGDILTSSRHLLRLINDILDLAKVESGKMEFHPEEVNINSIITEVCDILRTIIAKRKIQLAIDIDPNLPQIIIDQAKLKQILYNYVSNAFKFTPLGGSVNIRAKSEGEGYFRLEVEDNGIGIREEDIPKLFSEFQQLDASLDKKYQGTGLGLALTKRIAEAQGGTVGVVSAIGKGSTFFTVLPSVPSKDSQESPLPNAPDITMTDASPITVSCNPTITSPASITETVTVPIDSKESVEKRTAKVLVIEDNQIDAALVISTLSDAGYSVENARLGKEAIKICQEKQFDVITLDLLLPDMNGWDILRAFRSKGPNLETPAIVLTVIGSKASSFGFMIQNFLVKPINSAELIKELEQTGISKDQNKTILFVDDDPKMLMLCREYLRDYKSTVICENDPEKGLISAEVNKPDVIVLDLLMPNVDGLEFLRRFRMTEIGKKTPVIVCTSQDISDIDKTRIKASVAAVIQKGGGSMINLLQELDRICPLQKALTNDFKR